MERNLTISETEQEHLKDSLHRCFRQYDFLWFSLDWAGRIGCFRTSCTVKMGLTGNKFLHHVIWNFTSYVLMKEVKECEGHRIQGAIFAGPESKGIVKIGSRRMRDKNVQVRELKF